jgi:hypothetical protein
MRKSRIVLLVFFLACGLYAGAHGTVNGQASSLKQMKRQQRIERKQLKAEQKIWKRSFHGRSVPRAERLEEKHQFQRNMRNLRLQQKDQIQEIKDRQRLAKYRASHPEY